MADHPIDPRDHEPFGDRAFSNPPARVTLSGKPPVPGTEDTGAPGPIDPKTGMHTDYWVLSEAERAKGFVEPLRNSYIHVGIAGPQHPVRPLTDEEKEKYGDAGNVVFETYPEGHESAARGRFWKTEQLNKVGKGCGSITTMGMSLAETYAARPEFYGATFCASCKNHFPVGKDGEFVWKGRDQQRVGTRGKPWEPTVDIVKVPTTDGVQRMTQEEAERARPGFAADLLEWMAEVAAGNCFIGLKEYRENKKR